MPDALITLPPTMKASVVGLSTSVVFATPIPALPAAPTEPAIIDVEKASLADIPIPPPLAAVPALTVAATAG